MYTKLVKITSERNISIIPEVQPWIQRKEGSICCAPNGSLCGALELKKKLKKKKSLRKIVNLLHSASTGIPYPQNLVPFSQLFEFERKFSEKSARLPWLSRCLDGELEKKMSFESLSFIGLGLTRFESVLKTNRFFKTKTKHKPNWRPNRIKLIRFGSYRFNFSPF